MEMTTSDCLKKAILDSQEKVRDYMHYASSIKDPQVSRYFAAKAEEEGRQAHKLQEFLAAYDEKKEEKSRES